VGASCSPRKPGENKATEGKSQNGQGLAQKRDLDRKWKTGKKQSPMTAGGNEENQRGSKRGSKKTQPETVCRTQRAVGRKKEIRKVKKKD